jgi:hypothetical protein
MFPMRYKLNTYVSFRRNSLKEKRREFSSLRWNSNIWLWVLRDSDHWQIALQIADPSSRQRGRPERKSKAIVRQKKEKRKIWAWVPKGCPTSRRIGRLTISHNNYSTQLNSTLWKIDVAVFYWSCTAEFLWAFIPQISRVFNFISWFPFSPPPFIIFDMAEYESWWRGDIEES